MSETKEHLLNLIKTLPAGVNLGEIWAALKKLLPIDPTMKFDFRNRQFVRDFGKEGYFLEKNVRPLTDDVVLDVISYLKPEEGETSIKGEEMIERSVELGGNLGQRDCEKLLAGADKIPEALQKYYFLFPGTIWVRVADNCRCIPCLLWTGGRWIMFLVKLGSDFGWRGRLLVPRKKQSLSQSPNEALPSGSGIHEWQGPYEV